MHCARIIRPQESHTIPATIWLRLRLILVSRGLGHIVAGILWVLDRTNVGSILFVTVSASKRLPSDLPSLEKFCCQVWRNSAANKGKVRQAPKEGVFYAETIGSSPFSSPSPVHRIDCQVGAKSLCFRRWDFLRLRYCLSWCLWHLLRCQTTWRANELHCSQSY